MNVNFLGFSVDGPACMPEFMAYLAGNNKNHKTIDEIGRFLFIDDTRHQDFYLGLVITVKNQRTFCELKEAEGSFTVAVSLLDDGAHLMEFNFFIINKKNGLGLYQYYHNSCSVGQFFKMFKSHFHEWKVVARAAHQKMLMSEQGLDEKKAENKAVAKYKGRLKTQQLVRKQDLAKILLEYDRIKSLMLEFSYLEPESKEFGPLDKYVKKSRKIFSFDKKWKPKALASNVVNAIKQSGAENSGVRVADESGAETFLRLQNNPDNFGRFDYDTVAMHLNNLDVDQFAGSWVVGELLKSAEKHKSIFAAKIKGK